ncbi:M56 family metallopeptidase [Flavobacterium sp. DG1-102-2]|uniref:M56 family metallopeptidase n=1 Tax=Flavobacterium sp. DG1-102-2 TaxID=3081663 RepID=UPI002948FE3A|nr:M56 family metallopeptidase [Flavobacterium sp. DG1-102-2]MDV6169761.1 M56 family metallopeptidase [Flavobacterium sp. DG1-102-2]
MENFIIYAAKASGLIALFLIAYHALLKKETFFTSNRGFLLAGLFTAALLPFAEYTKVIWVDPAPKAEVTEQALQTVNINQLLAMQQQLQADAAIEKSLTISWWNVVVVIYLLGVVFFILRLVMDFASIRRILKGNKITKDGRYKLIDSIKVSSPFSFFNYIVYNSKMLASEELESIISHEKVHSRQKHSVDMIISQLFCIAFWFNPLMWLYRRSISQNLEFIADAVAIRQLDDKKSYQKTLLKITLQPECIAITNHFYQSLIKKRIVMLNKKQSKRRNSWKYAIVLPALAAFMLAFQVKVIAQEKAATVVSTLTDDTKVSISVDKDAKEEELNEEVKVFKKEFDADVTFSEIKRNASGEITSIKVNVKDKKNSKDFVMKGNGPIRAFTIEIEKNSHSGENKFFFGNPGKNLSLSAGSISYASTGSTGCSNGVAVNEKDVENDSIGYFKSGANVTNVYKGALVIVDGKKQEKDADASNIQFPNGQTISRINVLSPKEAKRKYGKEARKGAVEINTQRVPLNMPRLPNGFAYTYNPGDGQITGLSPMPPMPPMPPMEDIMGYAKMGVEEGMKALSEIDWQEIMDVEGLSKEDRKQIQEEMKRASIEAQRAMNDPEVQKSMREAHRLAMGAERENLKKNREISRAERNKNERSRETSNAERLRADREKIQSEKEFLTTQKEIMKAKIELEKMKAEIEKSKKELEKIREKNKSN